MWEGMGCRFQGVWLCRDAQTGHCRTDGTVDSPCKRSEVKRINRLYGEISCGKLDEATYYLSVQQDRLL